MVHQIGEKFELRLINFLETKYNLRIPKTFINFQWHSIN